MDFPNVIGQKGSDSDSEASHFSGVVKLKEMSPLIYRHLIRHVSQWEKGFGQEIAMPLFGSYVQFALKPDTFPGRQGSTDEHCWDKAKCCLFLT